MTGRDPDNEITNEFATILRGPSEIWTPECLEPERILALVDRTLSEAEAQPLMAHVALCARCRREYVETLELAQLADSVHTMETAVQTPPVVASPPVATPPQESRRAVREERPERQERRERKERREPSFWQRWFLPGFGLTLSGAAAAAAAVFFFSTVPAQLRQNNLASTLKERDTALAQLEQEKSSLLKELEAQKQTGESADARLQAEIAKLNKQLSSERTRIARLETDTVALQEMPLPELTWMRSERGMVRGGGSGGDGPQIALVQPTNSAVWETRPVLECRPLAGATRYQISLESEDATEELPAPRALGPTRWQVATPLRLGQTYRWSVSAEKGGKQVRSLVGKFLVLSAAQRAEIEAGRQRHAQNPLALGILYTKMGLEADAIQQFQAVLKTQPNHPAATRWLRELQQQVSRR